MSDLKLTQLITIEFDLHDPERHIKLVIRDAVDDSAAQTVTQWEAGEFDITDLLGSLWDEAEVEVVEGGETRRLTGAEFYDSELRPLLEYVQPGTIEFVDYAPAA